MCQVLTKIQIKSVKIVLLLTIYNYTTATFSMPFINHVPVFGKIWESVDFDREGNLFDPLPYEHNPGLARKHVKYALSRIAWTGVTGIAILASSLGAPLQIDGGAITQVHLTGLVIQMCAGPLGFAANAALPEYLDNFIEDWSAW